MRMGWQVIWGAGRFHCANQNIFCWRYPALHRTLWNVFNISSLLYQSLHFSQSLLEPPANEAISFAVELLWVLYTQLLVIWELSCQWSLWRVWGFQCKQHSCQVNMRKNAWLCDYSRQQKPTGCGPILHRWLGPQKYFLPLNCRSLVKAIQGLAQVPRDMWVAAALPPPSSETFSVFSSLSSPPFVLTFSSYFFS